MSELLWVAVPGGVAMPGTDGADVVVLRAVVVPRLTSEEPKKLIDHGMHDWPAALAASTLVVEVSADEDGPWDPVEASRREHVRPDVWRAFFSEDMIVRPWKPREYEAPVVEPTSEHTGNVVGTYRAAAQAIAAPPAGVNPDNVVRDEYAAWAGQAPPTPETGAGAPGPWEEPDFHRAVAMLREHPAVLRALGLIVELEVRASLLRRAEPATPGLVRVTCTAGAGLPATLTMVSPQSRYQFNGRRFLPAPRLDSDIVSGMIDLTGAAAPSPAPERGMRRRNVRRAGAPRWEVATFDADGAVGRLRDAARGQGSTADGSGRPTLPTLRSTGLTLVRRRRGEELQRRVGAARANAVTRSAESLRLFADDLVLGHRLDVRFSGGEWQPLCRRLARYTISDLEIVGAHPEEGHVKANAAAAVGSGQQLRASEVVAAWSGWSLAVPRPMFDQDGVLVPDQTRLPMPFDFRWNFELESGSLPKLRFGSAYHLRMRVADIAGGGLEVHDPGDDEHGSDLVLYRRHEPVLPPEIPLPEGLMVPDGEGGMRPDSAALGPGGTLEQLVIRSDPAATPSLSVAAFAAQHPHYPVNDRRTLVPPPGSMSLAEQHGQFDGRDAAVSWEWVQRATAPPVSAPAGQYSWLPDPGAHGVVLHVRQGPDVPAAGRTISRTWEPQWPDFQSKSLHLVDAAANRVTIDWDDAGLKATVGLGPAEEIALEISSLLDSNTIERFEIKTWLQEVSDAMVIAGRHPMVTPARVVQLVHAVRRPLNIPAGTLKATRAAGETFAAIHDPADPRVGIDVASTAQVELAGSWDEWSDGPTPVPVTERALVVAVSRGAAGLPEMRHEFGDTRHRRVTYTLTAISRFIQFFDKADDATPEDPGQAFKAAATLAPISIPSSARPAPPVVISVTPSFKWVGLEVLPDWVELHRSRLGGRLRVELARPWYTTGEGERLAVVVAPPSPTPAVAQHVTSVHRDPIWGTPSPTSATVSIAMFSGSASEPKAVRLAEIEGEVMAVPYAVWFDDGRWYADVELPGPAATSYCPFAQLTVARYQPQSLPGLELSTVVRTELVQLFPDRKLTIRRSAEGLQVLLEGLGPVAPLPNRVFAVVERCDVPSGTAIAAVDFTAAAEDGTAAWRPVAGHAVDGQLNVALPLLPLPAADAALRLVVREIEQIPSGAGAPANPIAAALAERTVFVDVVPITAQS